MLDRLPVADCREAQLRDMMPAGLLNHPFVVFVLSFIVLWLSAWIGAHLGRKGKLPDERGGFRDHPRSDPNAARPDHRL